MSFHLPSIKSTRVGGHTHSWVVHSFLREHEKREVELEEEEVVEHWHDFQDKSTTQIPRQKVQPASGCTVRIFWRLYN
jgi:hypothetical protein